MNEQNSPNLGLPYLGIYLSSILVEHGRVLLTQRTTAISGGLRLSAVVP